MSLLTQLPRTGVLALLLALAAVAPAHAELRTSGLTANLDGHEGAQFSLTLREATQTPKGELRLKGLACFEGAENLAAGCTAWIINDRGEARQFLMRGQSQVSALLKQAIESVHKDQQNALKPEDAVVVTDVACSAHVEECQILFTRGIGGAISGDIP